MSSFWGGVPQNPKHKREQTNDRTSATGSSRRPGPSGSSKFLKDASSRQAFPDKLGREVTRTCLMSCLTPMLDPETRMATAPLSPCCVPYASMRSRHHSHSSPCPSLHQQLYGQEAHVPSCGQALPAMACPLSRVRCASRILSPSTSSSPPFPPPCARPCATWRNC